MRVAASTLLPAVLGVALWLGAASAQAQTPAPVEPALPALAPPRDVPADAPAHLPSAVAAPAPPPAERSSIARRWWFWAGLGGAALAVVIAGIVLAPREPYQGNAGSGIVTLF